MALLANQYSPPQSALQLPQAPTAQVAAAQGAVLHSCCRGSVWGWSPQALGVACSQLLLLPALLAGAMQTALREALPPPQVALQFANGGYSQCVWLQLPELRADKCWGQNHAYCCLPLLASMLGQAVCCWLPDSQVYMNWVYHATRSEHHLAITSWFGRAACMFNMPACLWRWPDCGRAHGQLREVAGSRAAQLGLLLHASAGSCAVAAAAEHH